MPRKKLIYTEEFPYHIMARSNNKEEFYLPQTDMWKIFNLALAKSNKDHKFSIHGFTLMRNHYHLLGTCSSGFNLGVVMRELQKSVSRKVNYETGRINHVFGGPYKASLILTPEYYYNVLKYVYRNPIEAGVCKRAEDYLFSTLTQKALFKITPPTNGIDEYVPSNPNDFIDWINESPSEIQHHSISKGLRKTIFKPVKI